MTVYQIDGIQTIITAVRGNVAKGFILEQDLQLTPCYIVKSGNVFAHGKTLKEVQEAIQEKLFEELDSEERISMFLEEFKTTGKYPAQKFFDWHNKLTGSCKMGRESFCKSHGINVDTDELTVEEFIQLTRNDYGGEIIQELEERIRGM